MKFKTDENNITSITREIITKDKPWFKYWFNTSFYRQLYSNRDEKEATDFIDGLLAELKPAVNARVLDLGCGNGRHSKSLATKGFDVTGIDLASSSIRHAKKFESHLLRFYRHDMRAAFGKSLYDYVFNFFTSFGYFNDPAEDHKVVANISSALKPNGVLVMDYMNAAFAEKNLIPEENKEVDGIMFHIKRWSDRKYIFKKIVIDESDMKEPVEYIEQVSKFSLDDFDMLLDKHGLSIQQVYGDYRLNEYDSETSPRLILIAKKVR